MTKEELDNLDMLYGLNLNCLWTIEEDTVQCQPLAGLDLFIAPRAALPQLVFEVTIRVIDEPIGTPVNIPNLIQDAFDVVNNPQLPD